MIEREKEKTPAVPIFRRIGRQGPRRYATSVADLQALVNRVGYAQASRLTGLARSTIYGVVTGYGRRGRPRKASGLPSHGAAVRPEVRERLQGRITLAVLFARAVVVRSDQETGAVAADPDPRVCDVVEGDGYEPERDQPFTAMYFDHRKHPVTRAQLDANLDDYVIVKQQALEQATDRPPRPFVKRRAEATLVDNLGSPSGAVIVVYLWQIWFEATGGQAARHVEGRWTRPRGRLRDEIGRIVGEGAQDAAEAIYDELAPRRPPRP